MDADATATEPPANRMVTRKTAWLRGGGGGILRMPKRRWPLESFPLPVGERPVDPGLDQGKQFLALLDSQPDRCEAG
jgi:hypothetical protein